MLFAAGSACFLVAPVPAFLQLVGPAVDGAVFFAGSLLFTAAAALQWLETINANRGPAQTAGRRRRLLSFEPAGSTGGAPASSSFGCLAFGISAVTSYVVPSTGSEVSLAMVNLCTALGALCFLVGALLLLPAPRGRPTRMIVGALVLNGHPHMDQDGAFEGWWT